MPLTIAAIRTGTDPQGPLPEGSFHRTLDEQIVCQKCDATYNLVADYEQSTTKFFEEDSRRYLQLLRKTIAMGHIQGHKFSHFETNGVVVQAITKSDGPVELGAKPRRAGVE
ncbi:hypothetical protein SAMN05421770_11140 [Granulicella rosea]|uniref:Uncharacterized protein n=1 Tax=Granulicella rosea TaxID=474952 RepID=A0A239MD44_9BACT|nr:hypothetical protein [Granulicella rosea]SNT39749.1 hypothetical protein SAMN05421770_11140 [Granulicella rosea]